jgi:hypothetical protein
MYLIESSSPFDPGARPSNSFEDSILICASNPSGVIVSSAGLSRSVSGSAANAMVKLADNRDKRIGFLMARLHRNGCSTGIELSFRSKVEGSDCIAFNDFTAGGFPSFHKNDREPLHLGNVTASARANSRSLNFSAKDRHATAEKVNITGVNPARHRRRSSCKRDFVGIPVSEQVAIIFVLGGIGRAEIR